MHALNSGLVAAFPVSLREHALAALETFPEPEHPAADGFSVKVAGEMVTIPYRLYHSPGQIKTEHLTDLEKEIVDCLLVEGLETLKRDFANPEVVEPPLLQGRIHVQVALMDWI